VIDSGSKQAVLDGIAPAAAIAGLAVIAAVVLVPLWDHSPIESGVFATLFRFDRSLPLVGLGIALVWRTRRETALNLGLVIAGIGLAMILQLMLNAAIEQDFRALRYLLLVGPVHCIAVGLALLAPVALGIFAVPPASLSSGIAIGFAFLPIGSVWPDPGVTAGTALAATWLLLKPLLARRFAGRSLQIAARIYGGWLVAIGTMLFALALAFA
jgi:hypothetical protein